MGLGLDVVHPLRGDSAREGGHQGGPDLTGAMGCGRFADADTAFHRLGCFQAQDVALSLLSSDDAQRCGAILPAMEERQRGLITGATATEIAGSVERAVRQGRLGPGDRLPAIRRLGLPSWMYVYALGRHAYAYMPTLLKRVVRRGVVRSQEEDV